MIIGVVSDTHDNNATIDRAITRFKSNGVGLIIHCGDWKSVETAAYFASVASGTPVRGVLGNNDLDVPGFLKCSADAPGDFELFEGVYESDVQSRSITAYHGHHKPTLRTVRGSGAEIILLGHTHKPLIERTDTSLIVNPGSTAFAIPRSKIWRPSVAIVNTAKLTAEIVYLEN